MFHHLIWRSALALVLVAAGLLLGCGRSAHLVPPKQQVRAAIAGGLPSFLTLVTFDWEPISTGPESIKVNFKASVEAEEDLYRVEGEAEGPSKVVLLTLVQAGGATCTLSGFVVGRRFMDQWTLDAPRFQKGLDLLGKPRSAFGSHAFVMGTAEANAALQRQTLAIAQAQQLQQAALEEQERTRLARAALQAREEQARKARLEQARSTLEEQGRKEGEQRRQLEAQRLQEAAEVRQQLLTATAPGTRYLGTRTGLNGSVQPLCLVFVGQKDGLLRAEVNNPDEASEKRTFTGELRFNAQAEGDSVVAYTIVMYGLPVHKNDPDRNSIYERAATLKLYLTGQGLEGVAVVGLTDQFPVRLQRAGTHPPLAPGATEPQPGAAVKNQVR